MTIYLIRHAHAGNRSDWDGDDFQRPLNAKGRHQAKWLLELLEHEPIDEIYSSPATRCVESVELLADARHLMVITSPDFSEGADAHVALERVLERAGHNLAVCSHGDLIPKMIRQLKTNGMRTSDPTVSSKGSVWVLDVDDGTVVFGTYHAPH